MKQLPGKIWKLNSIKTNSMKIKIGTAKNVFMFSLKIYNGEIELLWVIEKEKRRWLWLCYSNAKHDKRVWNKSKGKYYQVYAPI